MKKIIVIGIFTFVICSAFNKPQSVSDYRDSYTGVYFCNQVFTSMSGSRNDTTSIVITKDAVDSVLQLNLSGRVLKVKLINKQLKSRIENQYCSGIFFKTDSLRFHFKPSGGSSYAFLGKKK